jgi:hypothetical protein
MKTNLLTSLLLLLAGAGLASGTIINFVPPEPVNMGDTFTVDINADDSAAIAGFQFDVNFDPTILNAVDAVGLDDFAGLSGYLSIDNVGGTISSIFGVTSGGLIDSGSGIPLAELTFTAIAAGDVTLSFANYSIVTDPNTFASEDNPSANSLDVAVSTAAPEPATWTMLVTAGTFLLLVRRSRPRLRIRRLSGKEAIPGV